MCKCAFEEIKARLIRAPIMTTLDWNKEFEIMCDASDYAMGAVLGQRTDNTFRAGDTLYLYLEVSEALVSLALFKEDENRKQRPIFFVIKSQSEVETRYTQEVLALRVVAKKLRPYF